MEINDNQSKFQTSPTGTLVRPNDLLSLPKNQSFKYTWGEDEEGLFQKILSLLYRWLDSFSDHKSYLFTKDEFIAPTLPRPYRKILALLRRHGMLGWVNFKKERLNDVPFFHDFVFGGKYPDGITDGITAMTMHAIGFSKDPDEAGSKMIGEFCERYFLTLYKNKNLVRSNIRALEEKNISFLNIDLLAGFSEEQKKDTSWFRWDDKSIFRWEKITRISTGEQLLAPAQLVYWNYVPDKESGEPFLRERNTNGCGGYFTKEGAILSGLYELVQRDAFLFWWLNSLTPPKITPESVPDPMFQEILTESKRYGFNIHCLHTTVDIGIPSFAVIIEDNLNSDGPHFAMGAGCGANPERALRRSLEEAWSLYFWAKKVYNPDHGGLPKNYFSFHTVGIGQIERTTLFANPRMKTSYEFLINGNEKKFAEFNFSYSPHFSSEKEELATAINHVERIGEGYEVYVFLPVHPLLSKLGYNSARVIVPQLIPLYLNETNAPLGTKRLHALPQKLGIAKMAMLNTWPHPFP